MSLPVLTKVLINVLFLCDLSSRTLWAIGDVALKTEKNYECNRCKALTDSFNYWLEKTSRGKYEGGDAAWEEAKLRSYARSEIRFVEIQEGLCSELSKHQDDCYTLAEETEQVLEKWWFLEDPNSVNLHTWLCIETLKYCCPSNHYGESCLPCSLDKDNKICSGHGRCDGEGTRKGNGLCVCRRGFAGDDCEKCSINYYAFEGSCYRCDKRCDGCSNAGPAACISCKTGWKLDSGVCIDVDECTSSICKSDQYCINEEGTYSCKTCDNTCKSCSGAGPLNCTSCEPTNYLWNGKCITDNIKNEIANKAIYRMTIYIGIFVLLVILYQADKRIALFVFILFLIYIYYSEKSLEYYNTFDVYTKLCVDSEAIGCTIHNLW